MVTRFAVALATLILLGWAPPAAAQTTVASAPADLQAQVNAHRVELDAVTKDIAVSRDREAELKKEIDALDRDRASLNQSLIDAGKNAQRLEGELDRSEQRLAALLAKEDSLRVSLASRREVLSEILAALQRMGDHPPPALLVRPEDALSAVRSAILLGAVVPNVRSAADQLADDLTKLVALRTDQEKERDRLKGDASALAEAKVRIALLLDQKGTQRGSDTSALASAATRTATLIAQAGDLRDVVARLDTTITASIPPSPPPLSPGAARPTSLGKVDRLAPSIAFIDTKGLLPMPANGRKIMGFGDAVTPATPMVVSSLSNAGKAQGTAFATRAGGEVVSPTDGTVAYAADFRSIGPLLIISAAGGYHVLLAGMERIDVQPGQFVLAGEPVAAMASQRLASAGATLVGVTEPVLYVEFRNKDGASIDPAPWWAASNPEKVGG
jgi:septal ring factor EnvC (AmiA/AmiB activator)